MARLGSTISHLAKLRAESISASASGPVGRLRDLSGFGSNPGALQGRSYMPSALRPGAPLVVVLHGCTQTAEAYDHGSGWSQLADELGFALLYPQQQRSNNPNLCFNWFSAADARRGAGEPLSIRQMIAAMVDIHGIDESRIFVTGLSAGGAMTSIMLATYPELFAGGAIVAGLPFGSVGSVIEALARMRGDGYPSNARLGALVRNASDHDGPWPSISVWQGSADRTVDASNAERIIGQWQAVQGITDMVPQVDIVDGCKHRVWRDQRGRAMIEAYEIAGMGHGTPLHSGGPDGCGSPGPFMLDAGISSTRHIASYWGLDAKAAMADTRKDVPAPVSAERLPPISEPASPKKRHGIEIGTIIEQALRKAGLMR